MTLDENKMEVLAQHHMLRALLVNVGDLARQVAEGDGAHAELLRDGARQLVRGLLSHMADEERLLEEMHREGQAPDAEHLAAFQHNHVHQRELIVSINARLESIHATKRLGELVEALTHAVTLDMEHEEESLFGTPPQPLAPAEVTPMVAARA
ncbi:hemerythrin domain-containing protein [Archangium sp.]|uniref:hemerythrin domain-containing protein n=1 Tax=Archangium sp. TaxID=1872627 RepID=UPI00389A004E